MAIDACHSAISIDSIQPYNYNSRKIVTNYGLWDQLRIDCGREWYLMLFVNELLAPLRNDTARPPHLQSSSKQVH